MRISDENVHSARQALSLLLVPPLAGHKGEAPTPAVQFFNHLEIYPGTVSGCYLRPHRKPFSSREPSRTGSKIKHFKELHKKTGLPYSEMASLLSTAPMTSLLSQAIMHHGADPCRHSNSCSLMMSIGTRKWSLWVSAPSIRTISSS